MTRLLLSCGLVLIFAIHASNADGHEHQDPPPAPAGKEDEANEKESNVEEKSNVEESNVQLEDLALNSRDKRWAYPWPRYGCSYPYNWRYCRGGRYPWGRPYRTLGEPDYVKPQPEPGYGYPKPPPKPQWTPPAFPTWPQFPAWPAFPTIDSSWAVQSQVQNAQGQQLQNQAIDGQAQKQGQGANGQQLQNQLQEGLLQSQGQDKTGKQTAKQASKTKKPAPQKWVVPIGDYKPQLPVPLPNAYRNLDWGFMNEVIELIKAFAPLIKRSIPIFQAILDALG